MLTTKLQAFLVNNLGAAYDTVKNTYSKHSRWLLPVTVLLLILGAFGAGRLSAPSKVVEVEKIVEKVVEKVVVQEKVVEKIVYKEAKREKTRTETTTTKSPDGTETTRTTEETETHTDTHVDSDKTNEKIVIVEKEVEKIVEKEKLIESKKPGWRIGAGVGVSVPSLLGHQQLGVPGLQGAVIQVEADRRVVGPFWMGVFANTQGTVGLTLSGSF